MRMWGTPVRVLCRQHLLGEHCEMHMFAGAINKGRDVSGWANKGQCITTLIKQRHDELASELERRGYKHASPMEENPMDEKIGWLPSEEENLRELATRCTRCSILQLGMR